MDLSLERGWVSKGEKQHVNACPRHPLPVLQTPDRTGYYPHGSPGSLSNLHFFAEFITFRQGLLNDSVMKFVKKYTPGRTSPPSCHCYSHSRMFFKCGPPGAKIPIPFKPLNRGCKIPICIKSPIDLSGSRRSEVRFLMMLLTPKTTL